jgi:hypothetical protein
MMRRLQFLIGSGVSLAAGLPSTQAITSRVLQGYQDEIGLRGRHAANARAFLTLLEREQRLLLRRLDRPRAVNYEDLYYLAGQIVDADIGEFENPAVESFVRELARKLSTQGSYLRERDTAARAKKGYWREQVMDLARLSADYIKQVVVEELAKGECSLEAMRVLVDAGRQEELPVDVFTLNHDVLLERCWRAKGVAYEDGFRPVADVNAVCYLAEYPEVTVWDSRAYGIVDCARPCIAKLHGSLDWWNIPHPDVDFLPPARVDGDPFHIRSRNARHSLGPYLFPAEREPVILVGTFNKMLAQARGDSFLDILCLFRHRLATSTRLVISGYGFGDKGINGILIEWLARPTSRALLITPDPEGTLASGRPAVEALSRALERGQLVAWSRGFERCSFAEIAAWESSG